MGRKTQKNLSLDREVADGLEDKSDELEESQSTLVASALRSCYNIGMEE